MSERENYMKKFKLLGVVIGATFLALAPLSVSASAPPPTVPVETTAPVPVECPTLPQATLPDCSIDPCLFPDYSGKTDDYLIGWGDENDRNGATQWFIVTCHVPVDNPAPAPVATDPVAKELPVTGNGVLFTALGAVGVIIAGAYLVQIGRRPEQQEEEDSE